MTPLPGADAAKTIWDNIHGNVHNLLHEKQGKLLPRMLGLALAIWAASGGHVGHAGRPGQVLRPGHDTGRSTSSVSSPSG